MQTLPPELINIIATYINKITDKRQFARTCETYNNSMKQLIQKQELIIKIKYSEYPINYCKAKFMFELLNDSHINKNPNYYLTKGDNFFIFS